MGWFFCPSRWEFFGGVWMCNGERPGEEECTYTYVWDMSGRAGSSILGRKLYCILTASCSAFAKAYRYRHEWSTSILVSFFQRTQEKTFLPKVGMKFL